VIKIEDIERNALERPDDPALVDGLNTLSWAEYARSVAAVRDRLRVHLEPAAGRRLRAAMVAENRWEVVVLASAFASLGIPWVGLDHTLGPEAVAHGVAELDPCCVVVSRGRRDVLEGVARVPGRLRVDLDGDAASYAAGDTPFLMLLDACPAVPRPWAVLPYEGLGFTSGTTGFPKLVLRSRPTEARRLATLLERFRFDRRDVHLVTVPLYHASGHGWARVFLAVGGTVVLGQRPGDPEEIARALVEDGISTTLIVPPLLSAVVDVFETRSLPRPPALRFLLTGGRHLAPVLVERCRRALGPVLHLYYGTTETGVNAMATPDKLTEHPDSAGTPFEGSRLAVLGPDMRPLPAGCVGRVAIASYMNMEGYASHPTPSVEIGGERHLVTGDHGWIDPGGRLFLVSREDGLPSDRIADLFGAEASLRSLRGVRDVALVRTRTGAGDIRLVAAWVPANGVTGEASVAIGHALGAALPGLPAGAVAVPSIPYSPTGKVRVEALRTIVEEVCA
jgi:acyl-coenzyme A synthetase/AMP-(fatty) acid ligase